MSVLDFVIYDQLLELEEALEQDPNVDFKILFQVASELGRLEILKCLIKYAKEVPYDLIVDNALYKRQLKVARFVSEKFPNRIFPQSFTFVESHLRIFIFVARPIDITLAKFLITHYAYDESSIMGCFELCLENGNRYKLVQIYLSIYAKRFISKHIQSEKFDWQTISSKTINFEGIFRVYLAFPFVFDKVSKRCAAYIQVCQRSRNVAATRIQLFYRRHVLYRPHSISSIRIAMGDWQRLLN